MLQNEDIVLVILPCFKFRQTKNEKTLQTVVTKTRFAPQTPEVIRRACAVNIMCHAEADDDLHKRHKGYFPSIITTTRSDSIILVWSFCFVNVNVQNIGIG